MLRHTRDIQECYDIQETYRNVTTYKRHTGMLRHTRHIQECYDIQETYRNVTTYKRHKGMLRHTGDIQECYDIQETYRNVTTYKRHTGMLRHTRDIQECYDIQETYRRSGCNRSNIRRYSPRRNMTNASALNAEATPYSQVRNSQENETNNKRRNFRGTEWGTTGCLHPREKEARQVKFRHLLKLVLEWKC